MEEALKSAPGTRRIMQTIHKRLVSNGDRLAGGGGGGGGGSLPTSLHPQLSCQKPGNWTRLLPGKRDTIREPEGGLPGPPEPPSQTLVRLQPFLLWSPVCPPPVPHPAPPPTTTGPLPQLLAVIWRKQGPRTSHRPARARQGAVATSSWASLSCSHL